MSEELNGVSEELNGVTEELHDVRKRDPMTGAASHDRGQQMSPHTDRRSGPTLRLVPDAADTIRREARARYPAECCGGLLGRQDAAGQRTVVRAVPVMNERVDHLERRYVVGPRAVLDLEREAEEAGLTLLGFFHSHPDHPAEPSEHDRKAAWPWYSYVIVPVADGRPGELRSWRLAEDRSALQSEEIL